MIELIPSRQVRDYHRKIGHKFTDFETATLIWNSPSPWIDILDSLKELADSTRDEELKKQLTERIEYESIPMQLFCENPDNQYVYVTEFHGNLPFGFFGDCDLAFDYARENAVEYDEPVYVAKQLIVRGSVIPKVKDAFRVQYHHYGQPKSPCKRKCCPADGEQESCTETDYFGNAVAKVSFNRKGEIVLVESDEAADRAIKEDDLRRFEFHFTDIPYPDNWEVGMIVKHTLTGECGVLRTTQKDWAETREKIKNGLYADYIDMSVTVMFLTPFGAFSHEHINPIYLEVVDEPEGSPTAQSAIKALSDYWLVQNGVSEKDVLEACKAHGYYTIGNEHLTNPFFKGNINEIFC